MTTQTRRGDGTIPRPNSWYKELAFLTPHPGDEHKAHHARLTLVDAGLYPTGDLDHDPGLATLEANTRAALHDLVEGLTRTDLKAIYDLTRLLVLFHQEPTLQGYITQRTEAILTAYGL